jgi:aspartyl-tRNA(Asn)/glutamyl-tRNA(Gln) amidotransferase subunit A
MRRERLDTMTGVLDLLDRGALDPGDVPPCREDRHNAVVFRPDSVQADNDTGRLAPFPGALKANIVHQGWPATCSSRLLENYISPFSATAVQRLEEAGARLTMVTAMDEFGMGSSCEYAATGPVTNPWCESRTPGGSSGGSAAAVAAGAAWFALGTDTGGSVRLPASFCGLVGFKPTWGRVSRHGLVPFASSLDSIGVLARSVADAALVMQNMMGQDPHDATSLAAPVQSLPGALGGGASGLKIGIPCDLLDSELQPAVGSCWRAVLSDLPGLGATVQEVRLPLARNGIGVYQILASAEAASNLARYDGSLYGLSRPAASYQRGVLATRAAGFGPEVKRRILWGTHVLAEGYRDELYLRARALRQDLTSQVLDCLKRVDVLALPTAPESAFPLGQRADDPRAMHASDVFTVPASLAGCPALSLPMGLDQNGLPLGLQLVGPPLGEGLLVRVGKALEDHLLFAAGKEMPWLPD